MAEINELLGAAILQRRPLLTLLYYCLTISPADTAS